MSVEDDALWKKRFMQFALLRLSGVTVFLLGIAVGFSDIVQPGGLPLLGIPVALMGVFEAVFAPRILKRSWTEK